MTDEWLADLRALRADGRQAFGRIAAAIEMSINTVSQRVARLIAGDAIRIAAIISPGSRASALARRWACDAQETSTPRPPRS